MKWSRISPWLPKATVAVEDKRFWEHGGIDPMGITRALWEDLRAGKVVQGGSTITQQLVRNLYISRERTLTRKLREACLAEKLAHKWSKRKILTQYLNRVYYGSQAYGVEAAAQTYFSKHAKNLTLSQAALLAGLPQAPSQYDPVRDPHAARARRNEVLRAMYTTGVITRHQYRVAVRASRPRPEAGQLYKRIWQPDFFRYVRDELRRVYGEARVRHGGLRVYTTIDPKLQRAARKAIGDTLNQPDDPGAAVVAIDPATGAIRAMTAVYPGRKHNQFNLISQARRQTGSTFKTFVLAAAVEAGMDPESTNYLSAPLHCDTGPCSRQAVGREDVRQHLCRRHVGREGDAPLRQHGVRAADARPGRGEGGEHGAQARRPHAARRARRVRPVDRSRLDRGVTSGHGLRVRHARRRRDPLEADGDHEGDPPERQA